MDLEQRLRVPARGSRLADRDPSDVAGLGKGEARELRHANVARIAELQERLYAEARRALLVVLQQLALHPARARVS